MSQDRSGRIGRALAAAIPFALAATAVMALDSQYRGSVFILLLLGVAYQAVVVAMRFRHRMFGVEFAAGLLLLGLLVATITGPRTGVLLLLPAGFAYLFVGLSLLQHESVRERLRRALPRRRAPPDRAETAVRRDLASLGLVIPACVLTLLLVPVATYTFPLHSGGSGHGGDDSSWRRDPGTPPEPDAQGLSGLGPPPADTPDRSFLRPAQLEVRPLVGGMRTGSVGALYLRGVPLVETGSDRWREDFTGLRSMADADDGLADEWCRVRASPSERDQLVLEVTMVVPELASTGELVLLGPPAETAFEVPQMRAKRGGPYLVARPTTNDPFDYNVEAVLPWRIAPPGTRVVARAPAKISADDESAASSVLADEARRAASGVAGGDLERIRAVMRHLRTRFEYEELVDRREGPTSIAELVATRKGTCIQFAKAGVVMLRHLGIASRVGTGFLVVDWDEGRAAYVVSGRDRHAWVEVEIEGSGWVVFDPTPAAPEVAKPAPDPMSQLGNTDPTPEEPRHDKPPGTDESLFDSVRMAIEDVCRFLGDLWQRATDYWPVVAIAAFVCVALAAHSMLARRIRLTGAPRAVPAGRGPWESLVAELARRGHHRRASQTASEFARAVASAGGAAFAPFVPLTARREAARFGALDLTPADEAAIDSFRASLPPR